MMTQRLRDSQMREARQSLEEAQQKLVEARQAAVVDMQEQSSVMSGEVELSLLSQRLAHWKRNCRKRGLSLQELRSNARPNPARVQPLERREEALQREIDDLRGP
jgi:capsular polysaccharide transport system permease protein